MLSSPRPTSAAPTPSSPLNLFSTPSMSPSPTPRATHAPRLGRGRNPCKFAVPVRVDSECKAGHFVSAPLPENPPPSIPINLDWRAIPFGRAPYTPVPPRPLLKMLFIAGVLFLLTLCTCLVAGTQFAVAYAHTQAVSLDEFLTDFALFYKHPAALAAGLPFFPNPPPHFLAARRSLFFLLLPVPPRRRHPF